MKQITLNFYDGQARRNRVVGWVLLVFGVLLVIGLVIQHNNLKTAQQRIRMTLAQQQDRQRSVANTTNAKEIEPQLQHAAAVIAQLSFPWNELFNTLERNITEDVALLSVEPDVKDRTITINGEARDWAAMLDYIRRLVSDSFFSDVHLVNHQIQQTDPQKPIRFVLTCGWSVPVAE